MSDEIDVPGAIEQLLALVDRTPGFPSGDIMVHPDELLEIIEKLTARHEPGCGCMVIDDGEGRTHLISNPCSIHGAERPVDFFGDGFWAGFRGGEGVDPELLDAGQRAEWDAGYGAGLSAGSGTHFDLRPR